MDSRQLIDAQFDRAVEIVQSLPKTGLIQTGYEEKLTMYSLYKQATVGDVSSSRPSIFDMLGRAKWDAWAKHRDLDQYEAKWLYVDALLKVYNLCHIFWARFNTTWCKALGKYPDKTVATDLIGELRSYGGDPGSLVSSRMQLILLFMYTCHVLILCVSDTLTRTGSGDSSSSGSTSSEDHPRIPHGLEYLPPHHHFGSDADADGENSEDGEIGDEARDLPAVRDASQQPRPLSSISLSSRYRTPVMGSFAASSPPPRRESVPPMQPLPNFETLSTFADPQSATSIPPSSVYPSSVSYAGRCPSSPRDLTPQIQSATSHHRGQPVGPPRHYSAMGGLIRPPSRALSMSLEHAVENVQAHLAALTERIDTLESSLASRLHPRAQQSTSSLPSRGSSGRDSPAGPRSAPQDLGGDIDDMGLWSLVLKPFLRGLFYLQRILFFFLRSEQNRSPVLIVVRRLLLDISFVFAVLGILRTVWRESGSRRREVGAALIVLWGAVSGKRGRALPGRKY
ncbi:ACBP-domain-containing protein [Gyrodon lividus]|nr:ACBP-domain-containing protein [Gyrodon lividus]